MNFIGYKTERDCLEELYSSFGKVIIAQDDRETWTSIFDSEQLALLPIKVYKLREENNSITPLSDTEENLKEAIDLQLAPNFCLGLICFSDSGQQELATLWEWWQERGPAQSTPQIFRFNSSQEPNQVQAEFWQRMYGAQSQENQALAGRIVTMQKQYLSLRTLHENMQNAFATVEEYLSQAKLPPLQLAFAVQPSENGLEPSPISNSNSATIKQLLPVSSRGLASIELHVAQAVPQATGCLKISLKACEDNTAIASWQIPYRHLSSGWLSLDLPDLDMGRKKDVELIVQWQTDLGPAPTLSLSKLQSIAEAKIMMDEANELERSLAVKIWRGLPGTRKVTSPYLLRTSKSTEAIPDIQLGILAQGIMAQVREVTPNYATDDFPHIQISGHGEKILTHPRANGSPTIAMLPFCFPPGAEQLTATVAVEHEKAGIVAYGMAIIDPETEPLTCLELNNTLAFSGWIEVASQAPQQILVKLDNQNLQHCHIVLAAKLTQDAPPDFAWAYWLNFELAKNPHQFSFDQLARKPIFSGETPIRDVSDPEVKSDFAKVQLIEDDTKIQVHPTQLAPTIALLSNFVTSGTIRIKALVCTEHEEASPIEYAMAVITNDGDEMARSAINSPSSALAFSGWQSLSANQLGKLELDLLVPNATNCHLVLATRIVDSGSQSSAWARWLKLELAFSTKAG